MKIISFLLIFLISYQCFADQSVTYLNAGDKAPYEGYIFTKDAEANNRAKLDQLDLDVKLIDAQKQDIDILGKRLSLYQDAYKQNDLEKYLYFFGGMFLAYGVLRIATQVNQR